MPNKARYTAPSAIILGDPEVGEGTWIGHFTVLDGSNGLKIGKNCSIASGVHIYTHSTHKAVTEKGPYLEAPVTIGDRVAIGANAVIMYGCIIGDNVCIPALTLLKPYTEINRVKKPENGLYQVLVSETEFGNCYYLTSDKEAAKNIAEALYEDRKK